MLVNHNLGKIKMFLNFQTAIQLAAILELNRHFFSLAKLKRIRTVSNYFNGAFLRKHLKQLKYVLLQESQHYTILCKAVTCCVCPPVNGSLVKSTF